MSTRIHIKNEATHCATPERSGDPATVKKIAGLDLRPSVISVARFDARMFQTNHGKRWHIAWETRNPRKRVESLEVRATRVIDVF